MHDVGENGPRKDGPSRHEMPNRQMIIFVLGFKALSIKWAKRKPAHAIAWGLGAAILLLLGIGGPLVALRQVQLAKEALA